MYVSDKQQKQKYLIYRNSSPIPGEYTYLKPNANEEAIRGAIRRNKTHP
jgi:hypothetical protein